MVLLWFFHDSSLFILSQNKSCWGICDSQRERGECTWRKKKKKKAHRTTSLWPGFEPTTSVSELSALSSRLWCSTSLLDRYLVVQMHIFLFELSKSFLSKMFQSWNASTKILTPARKKTATSCNETTSIPIPIPRTFPELRRWPRTKTGPKKHRDKARVQRIVSAAAAVRFTSVKNSSKCFLKH